jgi:hypothetical protein
VLDDAAFGAATEVTPKFISPADPAARWTGAHGGQAFFAYSTNYLIDVDNAIIIDVEATTAIPQAEVLAAKRMIERSMERFALCLAGTVPRPNPPIPFFHFKADRQPGGPFDAMEAAHSAPPKAEHTALGALLM